MAENKFKDAGEMLSAEPGASTPEKEDLVVSAKAKPKVNFGQLRKGKLQVDALDVSGSIDMELPGEVSMSADFKADVISGEVKSANLSITKRI